MSTRSEREFLKVQLLETQHLREMVAEHPLMSQSFAEREAELEAKLDALPSGDREARAVLRTKVNFRNGRTSRTYILKRIESFEECACVPVARLAP